MYALEITLSNSMLWQDTSEDDYNVEVTELGFEEAFENKLYQLGYEDVKISWGLVVGMQIDTYTDGDMIQTPDDVTQDCYHALDQVDIIYYENEQDTSYIEPQEPHPALTAIITPAAIEKDYDLSASTVRQYLKRHGDTLQRRGVLIKADDRTWLMLKTEAKKIWG